MMDEKLAKKIKELRNKKGFSQEELSNKSGLSLRTIQRVENGETEPRGYSLKRLANALGATPDELLDWTVEENQGYLTFLNLSALSFILFPLLGILIPFIMLTSKKSKILNINETGKALINFQITWSIVVFTIVITCNSLLINIFREGVNQTGFANVLGLIVLLYIYNIILTLSNSFRVSNNRTVKYFPKIEFIKN